MVGKAIYNLIALPPLGAPAPAFLTMTRHQEEENAGAFYLPCNALGYLMRQQGRNAKLILLDATNQQGGSKSRACSEWCNDHVSLDKPESHCWYSGRLTGMMSEKTEFTLKPMLSYRLVAGIGSIATVRGIELKDRSKGHEEIRYSDGSK